MTRDFTLTESTPAQDARKKRTHTAPSTITWPSATIYASVLGTHARGITGGSVLCPPLSFLQHV